MDKNKKRKSSTPAKILFSTLILTLILTGFQSLSNTKAENKKLDEEIAQIRAEVAILKKLVKEINDELEYAPYESPICGLSSIECNP